MDSIKMTIRAVVIAGAIMFGGAVGWSWTDFGTQRARAEIANASGNQVGSNQVPSPTQPLPSRPAQVSMNAADWNFQNSGNLDTRLSPTPGGKSFHFDFLFSKSDYYLVTTASPVLTQGWYVEMGGAIKNFRNPPAGPPALRNPPEGLPAAMLDVFSGSRR
jgi:hypothetical protein